MRGRRAASAHACGSEEGWRHGGSAIVEGIQCLLGAALRIKYFSLVQGSRLPPPHAQRHAHHTQPRKASDKHIDRAEKAFGPVLVLGNILDP